MRRGSCAICRPVKSGAEVSLAIHGTPGNEAPEQQEVETRKIKSGEAIGVR